MPSNKTTKTVFREYFRPDKPVKKRYSNMCRYWVMQENLALMDLGWFKSLGVSWYKNPNRLQWKIQQLIHVSLVGGFNPPENIGQIDSKLDHEPQNRDEVACLTPPPR